MPERTIRDVLNGYVGAEAKLRSLNGELAALLAAGPHGQDTRLRRDGRLVGRGPGGGGTVCRLMGKHRLFYDGKGEIA